MTRRKFSNKDIIKLLIKKAEGYHFCEEVLEYEKTQNKTKSNKINEDLVNNYSFFDFNDRVSNINVNNNDRIKTSDEINKQEQQNTENLTLVKKKVTTHYIPPDMLAIKILLEIYGKEMNYENLENLSDKELIELKNKLIKEGLNED